jgi:hypothetical protein
LNVGTEIIFNKAPISSVMIYVCPAWEFAADSYFLKFQRLRNKVLRTIGNLPRPTPIRGLHVTESKQVVFNRENFNICIIGQGEALRGKYKRLELGGGQPYDRSLVQTVVISLSTI